MNTGISLMGATSIIKNSVLEGFKMNSEITWTTVLVTVALALVVGLLIYFVYKRTYSGVLFTKNFGLSLVLLSMVTSVILMTISTNIAMSLGMVGALSIVRFRTAVKDAMDTMYMFWAIAEGIMIGAGLYLVSIIACVLIAIIMLILSLFKFKKNKPYVLVLRFETAAKGDVQRLLDHLPEGRLKSKTVSGTVIEMTVEMNMTANDIAFMEKFAQIQGVYDASVVSYNGDVVV